MGRRLTPYERRQREAEKQRRQAASRARTAARRDAERRVREREKADTAKKSKKLDVAYSTAMDAIMNLHLDSKHPYVYLGAKNAKSLASIDMTPDIKKTPFIPKKVPTFSDIKKEIKKLKTNYNKSLKMSKFSIKQYLKHVGRSGFFIFWFLNKEADKYKVFLEKNTEKAKLLKPDVQNAEAKLKEEQKNFKNSEEKRKADHIVAQKKAQEKAKKDFAITDKARVEWFKKLEKLDKKVIPQALEIMYPLEFLYSDDISLFKNSKAMSSINVGFDISATKMSMMVQLPHSFNFLPAEWKRLSRGGGNISTYSISDTERNNVFKSIVSSVGIAYLQSAFNASNIKEVQLEVTVLGSDPMTGNPADIVLLSMNGDRKTVESINFDKVDPNVAIKNFSAKFKPPKSKEKKSVIFDSDIKSNINSEKLIWCDEEDTSIKDMDDNLIDQIKNTLIKSKGGTPKKTRKDKEKEASDFKGL